MIGPRDDTGAGRPPLPDAEDRRTAVTCFADNLVVTAGAGTGKTSLLVERALNLIAGRGVEVASMAAITFTEKAAAELRARLAAGLDRLHALACHLVPHDPDGRTEADRAYAWLVREAGIADGTIRSRALAALLGLDAASVSTIHAFCADLLRRHPAPAGVDPAFRVDEGASFDSLFEEEFDRFLAEELGPAGTRADLWRRVLRIPGVVPILHDLARALSSFILPEAAASPYHPAGRRELLGPAIEPLLARVRDQVARCPEMDPGMKTWLIRADALLRAFLETGPAALLRDDASIPIERFVERSPAPGRKLAENDREALKDAAERARRLVRALMRVDEETVALLVEAAAPLASRAREALLRAGLVSFDALLGLARRLLRDHAGVRRDCGRRFRVLLLDEFQDTDPLQYEILFFIAEAEGAAAEDAYAARLEPGRLFIVGDAKQSIYRFRGADIDAYRHAVSHVLDCGGRPLRLTASFRSPADLVDPLDVLFRDWLGDLPEEVAPLQAPYESIRAARPAPPSPGGPRVEIWSVEAPATADHRRRAEAEAIARWIASNHGRQEATGVPLEYRHTAILMRALTQAGIYVQGLRRAGIPFLVEGGREFYERREVSDLIVFLRAASNPCDAPAVLAVLRSPLGGVTDGELARFAAAGGRLDRPDGGSDLEPFPGVRRTLARLARFRAGMKGRPVDGVIRAALEDTPLALLHAAAFDGAQRLANLRKLAARAQDRAREGLSLDETLDALEDDFRTDRDEGESPLADETLDAVRLLSIHKAKGLEYPVVFVPDLGRLPRAAGNAGTRCAWLRTGGRAHLAIELSNGITNLAGARHQELDRLHEQAEERRVFYVACTRARDRLILVNSSREKRAIPWRDALRAFGYESRDRFPAGGLPAPGVTHRLVEGRERRPAPPAAPPPADWAAAARRWRLAAASAAATLKPAIRWPAAAGDERVLGLDRREDGSPATPAPGAAGPEGATALLAGRAVHAALEAWDFENPGRLRDRAVNEARRAAEEELEPGDPAARAAAVVAETRTIIDAFLAGGLPERLRRATILGREVPILYRDDAGTVWAGACDLLYRDTDGTLVVADYKTDVVKGDPATTAARYRDQVGVYRQAIARAFPGSPVRGEVLFVRIGTAVPIDPA